MTGTPPEPPWPASGPPPSAPGGDSGSSESGGAARQASALSVTKCDTVSFLAPGISPLASFM
jgi:hypothetical protein